MHVSEPPVGRAAVLFMLVVFALLVAVSLSRGGVPPRPSCLQQDVSAEKCVILAGSTDHAGFLVLTMKRDVLDKGAVLGGFSFLKPWDAAPECKIRPDDTDYPKVETEITDGAFKILASQDARYPRRMQWFYTCAENK